MHGVEVLYRGNGVKWAVTELLDGRKLPVWIFA